MWGPACFRGGTSSTWATQAESLPDGAMLSIGGNVRPDDGCGQGGRKSHRKMHTEEQFKWLQEIHDLLADSRKTYNAIAHRVDDPQVKELLLRISSERANMESEVAQDLVQHDPTQKPGNGTVAGTVQRVMLTFRDILNDTNEVNVLVECERQDSALLGRYTEVLNTMDLNEASRATLARQYAELEQDLHQVIATREAMEDVEH